MSQIKHITAKFYTVNIFFTLDQTILDIKSSLIILILMPFPLNMKTIWIMRSTGKQYLHQITHNLRPTSN